MTEVTEFEPTTHWHRNRRGNRDGSYFEQSVAHIKSFLVGERWASLDRDNPGLREIPEDVTEIQQISSDERLLAGMGMWGSVYGVLEMPSSNGRAISVDMPSDGWYWCGDPTLGPRICLKKRMSILSHFDG
jgi:hypothetical protein